MRLPRIKKPGDFPPGFRDTYASYLNAPIAGHAIDRGYCTVKKSTLFTSSFACSARDVEVVARIPALVAFL